MQECYRNRTRFSIKSISLLKQGHTSEQSCHALPTALVAASAPHVNMEMVPVVGEGGLAQGGWWGCSRKNWDRLDKRLKEGKGKPMPKPIRCARETEQGDLMRDLKFSSTEDNSEAPLAPFTAVKGNQLLILLLQVTEVRFQHTQTHLLPAYHIRKFPLGLHLKKPQGIHT